MRLEQPRKTGWVIALILVCGCQFSFLPLYHFHPENTHSHSGELRPHHHAGHFHSHELESLGRAINPAAAPSDPANREHDADDTELGLVGGTAIPKSSKSATDLAVLPVQEVLPVVWTRRVPRPEGARILSPGPGLPPAERSPPVLLT